MKVKKPRDPAHDPVNSASCTGAGFFIASYPQIITDMSTETRRHISVGRHKTERVLIIIIINNNNSNPNNVESHGYYMVIIWLLYGHYFVLMSFLFVLLVAGISLQVDTLTDHSCSAESDGDKVSCRVGDVVCESGSDSKDKCEDEDDDDDDDDHELENGERHRSLSPKPVTSSPLTGLEASVVNHHHRENNHNKSCLDNRISGPHNQAVKPKLWSLAEIATSDPKQQQHHPGQTCPSLGLLTSTSSTPSPAVPGAVYSASSILGRPIYYTSPFYSNYTNYGNFSPLQGQGILQYNDGLTQTATEVNTMHKHTTDSLLKTNSNHVEQQFRPSHLYSKKGT